MPEVVMDRLADINEEFLPAVLKAVVRTILLLVVSELWVTKVISNRGIPCL